MPRLVIEDLGIDGQFISIPNRSQRQSDGIEEERRGSLNVVAVNSRRVTQQWWEEAAQASTGSVEKGDM